MKIDLFKSAPCHQYFEILIDETCDRICWFRTSPYDRFSILPKSVLVVSK